ncbi:MAG: nucleotide exchange factor GrpE, partial [Alphaproteobacteria bacterium]|nr:nucleotide exchange factor GrpE [Alphaproteobacteria bacterium]
MTEETPKQEETDAPEILNAEDPSCVDAQSDDAAQDAAPQDVAPLTPEEKIEALETELAKQKEQVLRQLAETENARRRAQR